MKKPKLLLILSVLAIVILIIVLIFVIFKNNILKFTIYGYGDSGVAIDAPDGLVYRFDAGEEVTVKYTIRDWFRADRITCSAENLTLLSPAEFDCVDGQTGNYEFRFKAPEKGNGKGKIVITVYFRYSNDETVQEHTSPLYCSFCDRGLFISTYQQAFTDLAMAKAQFDAKEITSYDYYKVVQAQCFGIDIDLTNSLAAVCSDKIEYSHYAAPYIEAIHNKIFNIKSFNIVPNVSDTIKRIQNDLEHDSDA